MAIKGKAIYLGDSLITLIKDNGFVHVDPEDDTVKYLLDDYPALAGYSVRQLKSTATNAIRVERTDTTQQDIGFDANGNLDTGSLLTFVGAGDGKVVTWYDQSGNGHDQPAVSGSAQIVTTGSVNLTNSLPSLDFNSDDAYTISNIIAGQSAKTVYALYTPDSIAVTNRVFELSGNAAAGAGWQLTTEPAVRCQTYTYVTTAGTASQQTLFNMVQSGSAMPGDFDMYLNGVHTPRESGGTGTLSGGTGNFSIGYAVNGNGYFNGKFQELIIFDSQLSGTDRTAVESEINSYYSIYV